MISSKPRTKCFNVQAEGEEKEEGEEKTMPETTISPASCDECPFHYRIEGTHLHCNYYNRGGHITGREKLSICKVESIHVSEADYRRRGLAICK